MSTDKPQPTKKGKVWFWLLSAYIIIASYDNDIYIYKNNSAKILQITLIFHLYI